MPSPEFLKLYTQDYRPELLDELGITSYIQVIIPVKKFYANNQLIRLNKEIEK